MTNEKHIEILAEAALSTSTYIDLMANADSHVISVSQAIAAMQKVQEEADEEYIVKVNQALFYQRAAELNNDITKAQLVEAESTIATLQARVEELEKALGKIAYPIKTLEAELKEGEQLNGVAAIQLSNDANYLKQIAKNALINNSHQDINFTNP